MRVRKLGIVLMALSLAACGGEAEPLPEWSVELVEGSRLAERLVDEAPEVLEAVDLVHILQASQFYILFCIKDIELRHINMLHFRLI